MISSIIESQLQKARAETALPSFGFFGSTPSLAASVTIDHEVDTIQLRLEQAEPEFLNFEFLTLYDANGDEIARSDLCQKVTISSLYGRLADGPADITDRFNNGTRIHSDREVHPWVEVRLTKPTKLGIVKIHNRNDEYASRSASISLTATVDGKPVANWCNSTSPGISETYAEILDGLRVSGFDTSAFTDCPYHELNRLLKTSIVAAIRSGKCLIAPKTVLTVLDIYSTRCSLADLTIVAYVAHSLMGGSDAIPTDDLFDFAALLSTPSRIQSFCTQLSLVRGAYTTASPQFVASKHAFQSSQLEQRKGEYLEVLRSVLEFFDGLKVPAILCYGTLLGAARDGRFIPHDDDVDILYLDGSNSPEQLVERSVVIAEKLRDAGFKVEWPGAAYNFHASRNGIDIDIFPSWEDENGINLLMERYRERPIPRDILLPAGTVQLYDETFPAPGNIPGFLTERYGASWEVADPYHEWPWPLRDGDDGTLEEQSTRFVPAETVLRSLPMVELDVVSFERSNDWNSYKISSLHKAMEEIRLDGDFVQVGVHKGLCASFIQHYLFGSRRLHLFDDFAGLATDWIGDWKAGSFALSESEVPTFDHPSVSLHKGDVPSSLADFAPSMKRGLAFVHIDCNMHQATKDALFLLNRWIVPGTVILFDEYMMESNGERDDGEHRAAHQWKNAFGREFSYLWRTKWMQVAVRVVS